MLREIFGLTLKEIAGVTNLHHASVLHHARQFEFFYNNYVKDTKNFERIENSIIEVEIDEEISKFRNQNLGFVFQFHHLLPEFTALENISIPQMIGGVDKNSADNRSRELLDIIGLADRWNHNQVGHWL